MRKITLSLAVAATVATTGSFAASDLEGAFKEGKTSGQIRAFYINRDYDKRNETPSSATQDRSAFTLGGKLGYETAPLHGISAGAMFYTVNGMGLNNGDGWKVDPSLFGTNTKTSGVADRPDATYLGQAYVQAAIGNTTVKIGRQELNTPLAGTDDVRTLPNLFEAAIVINKDLPNTTVIAGHVTAESAGSFMNGYYPDTSHTLSTLGLQSGYGMGGSTGKYVSMSKTALTSFGFDGNDANKVLGTGNVSDKGVSVLALINTTVPGLTVQLWDYYAWDIINAIYFQADYKFKLWLDMTASYQFWNENGIGDKLAGNVKSALNAVKLSVVPLKGGNIYGAISKTEQQVGATLNGGMITPWGGSPGFVQGTVTRLGYTAGTTAWKVGGSYDIIPGLNAHVSYAQFNPSANASYPHKAGETDFDITYKPAIVKNLELKLRGIYSKDFVPNQDFNEYRVIANYNF